MTRPQDLARDLGISGKTLRGWLRGQFPRSQTEHGQRWTLTEEQVQAAQSLSAHQQQGDMSRQHPRTVRRPMSSGGRVNSDEYYVIDLCDEILGEEAERGRRFPWLSG